MADQNKLIFVNADSDYEETSSTDSIGPYSSFKTTNYELTDVLLGKIVNAITSTTGAPDADKFIKTDVDGKIHESFLDDGDIDHGSIAGLSDDDHLQYLNRSGVRAMTGNLDMGSFKLTNVADGTADSDGINLGQLKNLVNGIAVKQPVRVASTGSNVALSGGTTLTIDGIALADGDRVLLKDQTVTTENGIYEVGGIGVAYTLTRTSDADENAEIISGMLTSVQEGTENADTRYMMTTDVSPFTVDTDSMVWDKWYVSDLSGGEGITITGDVIDADLLASGGLKFVSSELAVEPADFAGNGLQDDGADNLELVFSTAFNDNLPVAAQDLNSQANGEGASIIGIEDSAGNFISTNVEDALAELYTSITEDNAVTYTVGTGGVTKADLVYINANDTVVPLPISGAGSSNHGIGLAKTTESASSQVLVLANDTVISGVLTSETAGNKIFWTGTGLSSTAPASAGSRVWMVGVAKNSTDLHVDIRFVKKNA